MSTQIERSQEGNHFGFAFEGPVNPRVSERDQDVVRGEAADHTTPWKATNAGFPIIPTSASLVRERLPLVLDAEEERALFVERVSFGWH